MALHDSIVRGGRDYPHRQALLFHDQAWSYGDLDAITDRMAANLLACGLYPGDRVALLFTNGPEIVLSYYACFRAGLVAVPLNIRMKGPELAYVLNHSGARTLLAQPDLYRELEPLRSSVPALETCFLSGGEHLGAVDRRFTELSEAEPEIHELPTVHRDDIAVIVYTSGTTARPKGVTHTHTSLELLVDAVIAGMGRDVMSVTAAVPSLAHLGSLCGIMLPTFHVGGAMVAFPAFDPRELLQAIETHRVSCFWLLPVMYAALVQAAGAVPHDLSSVSVCISGGDTMPAEIRTRVWETFGLEIVEICGMTELVYSCNSPGCWNRPGSIGKPLPGIRMRLVDDDGIDVRCGEVGEILACGEALMQGYWRDPDATAAAVRDGWMHTGDLARQDEDGYYWFVGRKKDIIIRGGSNISPAEVEDALHSHPAVFAVGVVGAADPLWGQVIRAFVALKPNETADETALHEHLRNRLAAYKVPESIQIVPSLPIGLTGKIHRQTLREWSAAPHYGN